MPPSLFNNLASSLHETELYLIHQRQRFAELSARYDALVAFGPECTGTGAAGPKRRDGTSASLPVAQQSSSLPTAASTTTPFFLPSSSLHPPISSAALLPRLKTLHSLSATITTRIDTCQQLIVAEQARLAEHESAFALIQAELTEVEVARMAELREVERELEVLEGDIVSVDDDVQGFRRLAGKILRRRVAREGGLRNRGVLTFEGRVDGRGLGLRVVEEMGLLPRHKQGRAFDVPQSKKFTNEPHQSPRMRVPGTTLPSSSCITVGISSSSENSSDMSGVSAPPSSPPLRSEQCRLYMASTSCHCCCRCNFTLLVPLKRKGRFVEIDGSDWSSREVMERKRMADEYKMIRSCAVRRSIEADVEVGR